MATTVQADGEQEVADYAGGQSERRDDAQAIRLWAIFKVIADGGAEEKNFEAGTEAGGDFDQAVLTEEREQKSCGAGERGGDHCSYGPNVSLHGIPIVTFFYHVCRAEGYFIEALMSEVKFAFVAVWARAGCYLPPVVKPGIRKVGRTSLRLAQS
jgi:hypothetical protein